MAGHEKRDERAQQRMAEVLATMGRELRTARLGIDLSQASADRAIVRTRSTWSRMERGEVRQLSLVELGRALAVVGMDLHIRAYPGGQPLRDTAHLCLLERLRVRLGAGTFVAHGGAAAAARRSARVGCPEHPGTCARRRGGRDAGS